MASNKLIVEVVGDTSKLTSSLNTAQQQINRFAGKSKIHVTGLDPLTADIKNLKTQSEDLAAAQVAASEKAAIMQQRFSGLALKAGLAGLAVYGLGQNMQSLGGTAGKVGRAFSNLSQGDVVGFVKALQDNSEEIKKFEQNLLDSGDAAKAGKAAYDLARAGLDDLAAAALDASQKLQAVNNAFVDPTKIHDATSPGAIAADPTRGGRTPRQRAGRRTGITAAQRNTFFDSDIARQLDRTQDLSLPGQVSKLQQIADQIQKRIAVTKDITRRLNLEDQLAAVLRQRRGVIATINQAADAKAKQATANAESLKRQQQANAKLLAAAKAAALQTKQFQALGLGPDGQPITPRADNLRKQLGTLTARISDANLNLSSKLGSQLDGARKLLSGKFGKLTEDSRQAIQDLFNTIRGEFDKGSSKLSSGALTKTTSLNTNKILQGLGLSPEDERAVRSRLSQFNSAGKGLPGGVGAFGININPVVNLDGKKISTNTRTHNTVHAQRNPKQKRGPF